MATINYWGLSKKGTVTVNLTVTIDQLLTAIATDETLSAEYYTISKLSDPSKSSLTYGDSSTTLTAMGIIDGDVILCTTNQFGSRQELKPKCTCWCTAHCGFSCMTDGCDCPDCECADCVDKGIQRGYN